MKKKIILKLLIVSLSSTNCITKIRSVDDLVKYDQSIKLLKNDRIFKVSINCQYWIKDIKNIEDYSNIINSEKCEEEELKAEVIGENEEFYAAKVLGLKDPLIVFSTKSYVLTRKIEDDYYKEECTGLSTLYEFDQSIINPFAYKDKCFRLNFYIKMIKMPSEKEGFFIIANRVNVYLYFKSPYTKLISPGFTLKSKGTFIKSLSGKEFPEYTVIRTN
ncbi:hypothetical protein LEP1GSC195_1422 [Leptospira wolbachii serovar Codice str. CDC]|uniref:Uncharacterized protein n=1 Tax=Leptospira wolbachii serovar Codice str. CDC TaxID=1218599 RepID=R9A858_9LEPT|nr:hypothetical protein [Leptospira wolbachii]EOQ98316.1 hypothetical protein LEP1GSC195_1422 [Leptospira wolbachii serovar Codice str. CDC]